MPSRRWWPCAAARGAGVGEALLARLGEIATERGWRCVRWITADDNYCAQTLYDRVAAKTGWNTYEIGVGRLARADEMVPQHRMNQQLVFHRPTEADR